MRVPSSAEFRGYDSQPAALGSYNVVGSSSSKAPLKMGTGSMGRSYFEIDEQPPPFTSGGYTDPLFEKMRQTRQANQDYGLAV